MLENTLYIRKLIEKEKKRSSRRRKYNADICSSLNEEMYKRYRKLAAEMLELYLSDPTCSNSNRISTLCSRYLQSDSK